MEKRQVRLAVREFVESIYMEGDLTAASSPARAMEGMRVHKSLQSDRGENYSSEVSVNFSTSSEYIDLQLFGRIDGLTVEDGGAVIEEIKSVRGLVEKPGYEGTEVHWAQAKVYAAIYSSEHGLEHITVQLVYFDVLRQRSRRYEKRFSASELMDWLMELSARYLQAADREEARILESSRIIREMGFPYERVRPGQQEMLSAVYQHVRSGGFLYVSAPTGTGKTMGALFPAVKAMADGHCRKLFYLTARNPVKAVAEESLKTLIRRGFALRGLTLTSKDKLCPMPEGTPCDAEACPRAAGFYDRLFSALDEVPAVGHLGRREVEALAERHRLCPHELSLFIAEICDVVICDYNHAFDPRVRIKRFFERGGEYTLLIDEAHNLVDRGRDMFSAELAEPAIRAFLDGLPLTLSPSMLELADAAQAMLQSLAELGSVFEETREEEAALEQMPDGLLDTVAQFLGAAEPVMALSDGEQSPEFIDLFFLALFFRNIAEEMDECYRVILRKQGGALELQLRCIDPSKNLKEVLKRIHGAVYFSATLTPFEYYSRLTGTGGDASCLLLPSPFPQDNLKVMALDIETTYAKRDKTLPLLVEALTAFVRGRTGNYLIFFPSYQYMQKVHELFTQIAPEVFAPMQTSGMGDRDRAAFLRFFDAEHEGGMAAFAVMGGIFGEGIDLAGDKVIGVAIVGVGMPQLCLERNLIQRYHEERDEPGYDFSYVIPGFNRVMQAVGRLIRNDTDRGVVLLADRRFGWQKYEEMTPPWWQPVTPARSAEDVGRVVKRFWDAF